ncbi:hypothetical protein [Streptomyces sp. NPDC046832]|uniref:hypothetical protein n=1 Tax=Streptomyces sp. NPDC046832 TaxID=3155020 RepID=UPI0033DEB89A
MEIIVVQETRRQMSEDFGPGDAIPYIEAVHAAPADPADTTLCRKPTRGMDKLSYAPAGPGSPWYPPNKRQWMCRDCDEALQSA